MKGIIRRLEEIEIDVDDWKGNPFTGFDPYNGPECCRFCPNNPRNNPHSGGFCQCALPAMEMFRPGGPRLYRQWTESYTVTTTNNTTNIED